jgi:hypothetical protein
MPEESLAVPPMADAGATAMWTLVARNERVNRAWINLTRTAGENAAKCYDYLRTTPMVPRPRRAFPLRGKRYAGAWEYEVTGGDRVFYVPDPKLGKVTVYYAGPHPEPAPLPPGDSGGA